jgi:hypothetical protein
MLKSSNQSFMTYIMWCICPLNPIKTLRLSKNNGEWKSCKVSSNIVSVPNGQVTFEPINIANLVQFHFLFQSLNIVS